MEIRITEDEATLSYFGWELGEVETYRQELAYNIWEQRDSFL